MKYSAYLTTNISSLENEELICTADDYQEICKRIDAYLNEHNIYQEPYWRFLMDPNATFIDFGSWSKFVAIVPPVSNREMIGED